MAVKNHYNSRKMIMKSSKIRTKRIEEWIRSLREPGGKFEMVIKHICGNSPEFIDYQKRWYQRILETFGAFYGKNAEVIIARTPARVNLIGMHIDHRGGHVNPYRRRQRRLGSCEGDGGRSPAER